MKLEEVFALEHTRVVANDWTVRHKNVFYQILKGARPQPKPKDKVLVRTLLDATIQIVYRDTKLQVQAHRPTTGQGRHEQGTRGKDTHLETGARPSVAWSRPRSICRANKNDDKIILDKVGPHGGHTNQHPRPEHLTEGGHF